MSKEWYEKDENTNRRVCFISASYLVKCYKDVPKSILEESIFFFGSKRSWLFPSNDMERRDSARQPTKYLKFPEEFKKLILKKEKDGLMYFLKPDKDYKKVSKFLQKIDDPYTKEKYKALILDDKFWNKTYDKKKDGLFRTSGERVVMNYKLGDHGYGEVQELLFQSNKTMIPILGWDRWTESYFSDSLAKLKISKKKNVKKK